MGPNEEGNENAGRQEKLDQMRQRAKDLLAKIEIPNNSQSCHHNDTQRAYFDQNGFLHLSQFANLETEVIPMKEQMQQWVEELWHVPLEGETPESSDAEMSKPAVFRTDKGQEKAQGSNRYFLDSANKVHFFAEKDAIGDDGCLKKCFAGNKMAALNKAGHGLHTNPSSIFHQYTFSTKLRKLLHQLGYTHPVIPQSMYIAKQAKVGGVVTSHQDSTFLYTTPKQTCLGLWLALDDATLENGCLWVRPGSHLEDVRRKFVRNPAYFGGKEEGEAMMVMEKIGSEDAINAAPWDGDLPKDAWPPPCSGLFDAGFIPIECKAGDLLAFPGRLDHLSLANHSEHERHTFQLHLVEGPKAGITWDESNWLQYPEGEEFLSIELDGDNQG